MRLGVSQGQIVREQLEKARAAQGGRRFTPREAPTGARVRRLGFLAGKIEVPDDFDDMGRAEIKRLFENGG